MKVILCCLFLFILLACPVTSAIAPIQNATKVTIASPTPHTSLIEQSVMTIITTPTVTQT